MTRYLLNPFDEAERLIQDRGEWIVATVAPRLSWPKRKQIITYGNINFILFPQSEGESAGIGLRTDLYGLDANEARKRIMQLCSALSWAEGKGIEIIAWGGGSFPCPVNVRRGQTVIDYLQADHLPHVDTNEGKAALALYREGVSLDNPFYGFLSLYKAISVVLPDGKQRASWIESTLEHLDNHRAKERRNELVAEGMEVGQYIWDRGRNAIAHAERDPYINPDEVEDHFRLHKDVPLLKNLAELAIEQKAGIRRTHTIWRDHLYELEGFRQVISADVIRMLECSEIVPEGTEIDIPDTYSVLARRGAEIHAFQNIYPEIVGQIKGGMMVDFVSNDKNLRIRAVLNFADERLQFDPIRDIAFTPNRNDTQQVRNEIEILQFQRCILSNGRLEVWDPETETMLGRSDTCIPVNCFINDDFYTTELTKLRELLGDTVPL